MFLTLEKKSRVFAEVIATQTLAFHNTQSLNNGMI